MPITLLDIFLLAVMLISGILAMIRGFMREVLSIAAWGGAALVTLYGYPRLLPAAKQYVNNDIVAAGVTAAGLFIGTLIIISILTVRIADMILDSRIGALDRPLGFLFGLARGLLIVVVAFVFFDWLAPVKQQPSWVTNAKSRVVLKGTGEWLQSLLPEDLDKYLSGVLKKRSPEDEEAPVDTPPDRRSDAAPPATTGSIRSDLQGYDRSDRNNMRQLIDGRASR
jgi:membrane protein required for colicin V production